MGTSSTRPGTSADEVKAATATLNGLLRDVRQAEKNVSEILRQVSAVCDTNRDIVESARTVLENIVNQHTENLEKMVMTAINARAEIWAGKLDAHFMKRSAVLIREFEEAAKGTVDTLATEIKRTLAEYGMTAYMASPPQPPRRVRRNM